MLHQSGYNWFEFIDRVEDEGVCDTILEEFSLQLPNMKELDNKSLELVVQSHRAFIASKSDSYEDDQTARFINGEIASDSDSSSMGEEDKKKFIQKKRQMIKRRVKRLKTKAIAEKRFLSCGVSRRPVK